MNKAKPTLKFTPLAWAKLLFLRDYGDTEVGAFGISAEHDLLLVDDVRLVAQSCSPTHVAFDDESVAEFFDLQVDAGRQPEQFGRIWIHTHPGDCPLPSITDEETFERVFCRSNWAVMFILAREGQSYGRLRFNVGPGADLEIPMEVEFSKPFAASDHRAWEEEYLASVQIDTGVRPEMPISEASLGPPFDDDTDDAIEWYRRWNEYVEAEEERKEWDDSWTSR